MAETIKYERRIFTYFLTPEKGQFIFYLLDPLEKVIIDLGGYPGIDRCHTFKEIDDVITEDVITKYVITEEKRDYLVGKKNGAHSLVTLEARLDKAGSSNFIKAFVVNVENHEHKDLLAALHVFYDGKPGYRGMPEPDIKECNVKI